MKIKIRRTDIDHSSTSSISCISRDYILEQLDTLISLGILTVTRAGYLAYNGELAGYTTPTRVVLARRCVEWV